MRSILNKILGNKDQWKSKPGPQVQFPQPISIDSPFDAQKRALIGLLARKLAKRLNTDKSLQDSLIYLPFTMETFAENQADEADYLLFLSNCMVNWIMENEDVYLLVRELQLPGKYHESFLKVYEEEKENISSIFHPKEAKKCGDSTEEGEVWQVYRDVMYAVTQGKFLLVSKREIEKYKDGKVLCEAAIKVRSDIPKAREIAKSCLLQTGFSHMQITSLLLVISEAITNVLKHAVEGKMVIVQNGQHVNVIVEDRGPGFDLKLLPNSTLMVGYSTKKSLGQGFTLMMKMADQLLLSTSSEGSCVILVFYYEEGGKKNEDLAI
ncbi:ATP-binding protein [Brevibacillus sp. GCM10020057]|uniref:ATP-binding protein n=1 Tax=Brevibacillus sp. GCM10020057 TaxID=3317327 RepID=UPI003625B8B4